jgi:Ca2+-binding RTX toxin-like protein
VAEGKDWVLGGNEQRPLGGDKNLVGGPGNDGVLGGEGSDNLTGNSGNDAVNGSFGPDNILGGEGNDLVDPFKDPFNKPAKRDFVTCGRGFDRVLADTEDLVAPDCEKVAVGLGAAQELDQQLEDSGFYENIFEGLAPSPIG